MNQQRKRIAFSICWLKLLMLGVEAKGAAFTEGNLVVYRVGDGSAALASAATAVFLDEYSPVGVLVQSIALPTAATGSQRRMTASGTAISEGFINRSFDGQYLVVTGYDAALATASVTSSTGTAINRVIGRVAPDGTVDSSTALADFSSGGSPRSAAAVNGAAFYVAGGAGGIRYVMFNGTTSVQLSSTPANLRVPGIFAGQLFVSTGSGSNRLATVGSGLPTEAGNTIANVPGFPSTGSPYAYALLDLDAGVTGLDTLYVASDDAAALTKYSQVGGIWVSNGVVGVDTDDYRGLAASAGGGIVTLYASRGASTLVRLQDSSGYNGAFSGTPATVASAASNTAMRGVAFAPVVPAPVAPVITMEPLSLTLPTGAATTLTVVATGSGPLTYQWYQSTSGVELNPVGEDSASFTTPPLAMSTSYWVKVANGAGAAVSSTATVTVTEAPQVVSTLPAAAATLVPENTMITLQFSKPVTLTANAVTLTQGGTAVAFTGLVPAPTGVTRVVLSPIAPLLPGTPYDVTVVGLEVTDADSLAMAADYAFGFATLAPVAIDQDPFALTRMEGQNAVFTVAATGDGPLSYDWLKDGVSLGAPNSATLALTGVTTEDAGGYSVMVSGPGLGNAVASSGATLTVVSPNDPIVLTGASYVQDFDALKDGLPVGWSVRTMATASALGALAAFNAAGIEWGATTGSFRNSASATGRVGNESTSAQLAVTNRALGLRSTGGFGDPGAEFAFTFSTLGKNLTGLSLKLQLLNAQGRSTAYSVQVGIGALPTSWETLAVHGDTGAFGNTDLSFDESVLASLDNQVQVWFRVVSLTASSGGGSRDTVGLDDFTLTYEPSTPGLFWDKDGAMVGAGGTIPAGVWGTDGYWSTSETGEGVTGSWIPGEGAAFSAGSDATGAYGVSLSGAQSARSVTFEEGQVSLIGDALILSGGAPRVVVNAELAVMDLEIQGIKGLRKIGSGELRLTRPNTFTGPMVISGGTVQIAEDAALGDASNPVTLNGTLQTTATLSLAATRTLEGAGTLRPAAGTVLTLLGKVNAIGLSVVDGGEVAFNGASNTLGALTLAAATTVSGNKLELSAVSATHASGTSVIENDLDFGLAGTVVAEGDSVLQLGGALALGGGGINRLTKTGSGSLVLNLPNPGLNKLSVGLQGATPADGGRVQFGDKEALGATQVFFNYGVLEALEPFTGDNALAVGISVGGREGSAVLLDGEATEFAGISDAFAAANTFGDIVIQVENTSIFSGAFNAPGSSGIDAIRFGGSGTVVFSGAKDTFREPIKLVDTVTLVLDTAQLGDVTAGNPVMSLAAGAKLVVGSAGGTRWVQAFASLRAEAGSIIEFDIGGPGRGTGYDALDFEPGSGGVDVVVGGTVKVNFLAGYAPQVGHAFRLLGWDATATTTDFTGVQLDLPSLPSGLSWDSGNFATDGVLVISGPNMGPVIVRQPAGGTVTAGASFEFSVDVLGAGPLTYVWKRDGVPLGLPSSSRLTLTGLDPSRAGRYSVTVSNANGSSDSNAVELIVNGPPFITVPPQSAGVAEGTMVTFGYAAVGPGLFTQQWQFDGVDLFGEVNPMLVVVAGPATHGRYRVVVTNSFGATASVVAGLFPQTAGVAVQKPEWGFSGELPAGKIGVPYRFDLDVKPDDPVNDIYRSANSFSASGLPTGLQIDPVSGELFGTPAASKSTPYAVSVTARNAFGTAVLRTRILVQSLPAGALGMFTGPIQRSTILNGMVAGNPGELGGRFDMTVSAAGLVTGKVTIGTKVYPFRSRAVVPASPANRLVVTADIKLSSAVNMTLRLLADTEFGTILDTADETSTVSDGTTTVAFSGWQNPWSRLSPATALAGYYTTKLELVDGALTSAQVPVGAGYLSFTVAAATGKLTLAGRLSDGSAITMATFAGAAGQVLLFRPLYAALVKGSVLGKIGIDATVMGPLNNTVFGNLTWSRPANGARSNRLYKDGFPMTGVVDVEVTGARYQAPEKRTVLNQGVNSRVMGLTEAADQVEVLLTGAGVEAAAPAQSETKATVSTKNKATFDADPLVNTRRLSLTFNAANGTFSGTSTLSDTDPVLLPAEVLVKRTITFQGLIVDGIGEGYFRLNQMPALPGDTPASTAQEGGKVEVQPVSPVSPLTP
jgi:autotransporter-associated beta strand protein